MELPVLVVDEDIYNLKPSLIIATVDKFAALPWSERTADLFKLVVFLGILAFVGTLARRGRLPRTRPIVPGELAVSD